MVGNSIVIIAFLCEIIDRVFETNRMSTVLKINQFSTEILTKGDYKWLLILAL